MIADALKYLAELARGGQTPVLLGHDDPEVIRMAIGGQVQEFARSLPPRDHAVSDVESFVSLVDRLTDGEDRQAVVWVSEDQVVAVFDDDTRRRNRATLALTRTDQSRVVGRLGEPLEHRAFLRLLRVDLAGAIPASMLLEKVRKVDFENGTVVRSKVGRNDESMGREINSRVQAGGELPETVPIEVRLWHEFPAIARVQAALDVQPIAGTLALVPLPDQISLAIDRGIAELVGHLSDGLPGGVPVYRGRPDA